MSFHALAIVTCMAALLLGYGSLLGEFGLTDFDGRTAG